MPRIKSVLTIVLFLIFTVCFSQNNKGQKPFSFRIDGSIRNYKSSKVYLHHKWDEKDYTDSAAVSNGRFVFQLKSYEPNMYWFTLSKDLQAQPNLIFFADQNTLTTTLIGDSLAFSIVEGGQTQRDYLEFKKMGSDLAMQQKKLQTDYNVASQKGDVSTVNNIMQEYQKLVKSHVEDLKTFVKKHPRSAVSGYVIYQEFNNPDIPVENAIEALSYIDPSMENTKFAKLAKKRIDNIKGTQVGGHAADFSQPTAEGKPIKLSSFKGKYVLVDFWASWCGPCRMENPNVVSAYNKFKEKGFTVLGVSLDSNKDLWMAAVKSDGLSWTNVCDLKGGVNDAAILYNIQTIPQNVLIDKEGKILARNLRGQALEEKLSELLR